jgi:hypothetical protein
MDEKYLIDIMNNPKMFCKTHRIMCCNICDDFDCCDNDNPLISEIKKLRLENKFTKEILSLYQNSINKIDDFFEYSYKSRDNKGIKCFMVSVLELLTNNIKRRSESVTDKEI